MVRFFMIAPVLALFVGCVHGTIEDPYEDLPDDGIDQGQDDVDPVDDPVEDAVDDVADSRTCEDFVTSPHNACDGHADFSLDVVSEGWTDDGYEVTVSFHSQVEWMNYPGVLLEGDDFINWWYGIFAGDTYEATFIAPEGADEMVFTAGALNCQDNMGDGWQCPVPGQLIVEVPAQ